MWCLTFGKRRRNCSSVMNVKQLHPADIQLFSVCEKQIDHLQACKFFNCKLGTCSSPLQHISSSLYCCITSELTWCGRYLCGFWWAICFLITGPRPALLYFCYLYERLMQVVCCEMCLAWSSGPISSSSGLFRLMLSKHLHLYSLW